MKARTFLALLVLAIPFHLLVALALTGVPRPPAVTAEDVGRVGWSPVFDDASRLWRSRTSSVLATWMPDGSGLLVNGRRWVVDTRTYRISEPGDRPAFVPEIPRNAGLFSDMGRDYIVLSWDSGGNEQYGLYRWDLGAAAPVPLTMHDERAAFGAFEPGGPRIAYTSTRRNGRDFDVYVMDPRVPATDARILEVEGVWGVADWSPDGESLLLIHALGNTESELYRFDVTERTLERVSPGPTGVAPDGEGAPVQYGAVQWSRDGRALLYTSDRGTEFSQLRRLEVATVEESVLSDEIAWDVASVSQSPDGEVLLLTVNEDGSARHYLSDPHGGRLRPLELFSDGQFRAVFHPDEPVLLVNHSDADGSARGYTYDLRTGELTQWVGPGPSASRASPARLVRFQTFDSLAGAPRLIPAFVYPGEGEGPRPVLIDIHGGPEAQARLRPSGGAMQRAGITVITPNVRGSTGYGRTFASLDDQYLREDAVRDIGMLLDWIGEQPDMDVERVAVMGGSYGGYMTLASLVHYGLRLRCGIDVVGVSNFVTFLENTADYRRDLRRAEYGDERIPEIGVFLESISPLNHAERIASPLMVVQGKNDPRVPVGESRQLVERVRGNGLGVAYMEGANEGHGFRHPWNAFYAGVAQQQMIRECLL